MQNLTIQRTNGNVPRTLAGEDHISGLLFYNSVLPTGFSTTDRIKAVSSIETAENLGITADAENWGIRVLHYQLTEIFNLNPAISLYLGIFSPASGASTFAEIKKIQNFAGGRIRQIGVWNGSAVLAETDLNTLQSVRTALEQQNQPLSIFYAPNCRRTWQVPNKTGSPSSSDRTVQERLPDCLPTRATRTMLR